MNIREALLEPSVQIKSEALKIADYATSSKKRFDELMQCFLSNEYRLQQRAAWCVSMAARKNKQLIISYVPFLVQQLSRKDVHDAILRNSLRILQEVEIPAKYFGETMNACFAFVESATTPIAIKAFALTVLGNIAQHIPEIKNEIKLLIDFQINNASAGFKARAKQVLKQIN
ncbi:hypothetical protein A9P82_12415 [Arachidicoccus ginsenosidimutans]|uniref:hypothetical protein n=1 Tax=Arachidicoccus sp. BS20 TaxID=1850526 RepID=UPI0007F17294|nr:hypothetical protein [Arachidicoccus sp. BS20]ANI90014.1 hypothetical protein A9P82_12415 [Arachidicoccus sp. BS20]